MVFSGSGDSGCPLLNVAFNSMVGCSTFMGHSSDRNVNWQQDRMMLHQLHNLIIHLVEYIYIYLDNKKQRMIFGQYFEPTDGVHVLYKLEWNISKK